ncbi:hypothetical protein DENIS_1931 [Desulfonema ishimotonii]|uniref:Uncharacterized protein n=1 Tax=Desulfonema ishimotonii TaxID=45657 RepID=A0A401FVI4_9BACT|nr:hypothetical protein [Desulfonema ishimotonii]GBC60971.1 hypothetical protein DENIS_1931 [Desulfonema ishimotonii]
MGILKLIDFVGNMPDLKNMFPGYNVGSNLDGAGDAFLRLTKQGVAIGTPHWIKGYLKSSARYKKFDSYLVYMPAFSPRSKSLGRTTINGIPVKLVFGMPQSKSKGLFNGGSIEGVGVFGLGVEMGKGTQRQLLRMDIGPKVEGHKIKGGEIDIAEEDHFHMHIYDWDGKRW